MKWTRRAMLGTLILAAFLGLGAVTRDGILIGGAVWTQGTGEVYPNIANDDVVPNAGTGLIGQSDDRWDIGYFETIRTSDNDGGSVKLHGSGVGGNLNITLNQTSGSYLHWLQGIFTAKDSFSSTNREMSVVVAGMNILINSKESNGGANAGAIRLANITTMAGATDKIITVENPTDIVKAYVGFDGDWWSATGEFRSGAVSGGTGFLFNTDATFSAGDIFAVQNNGTEAFSIEDDNNIHIWGSIDSEVLDGGIAYDFNPINTFTSGTIFRFLNNSVITLKQEYTGRLALKMTDASGVVKIRAGESGDRHAFQLEATLNNGEAGNGAFILAHTGTTLATSGDDLLKVKNNTATMLNLDYLGNHDIEGYAESDGIKLPYATKTAPYAITLNDYLIMADASVSADGFTVTLPDGTADGESIFVIKKTDSTTMYITVDGAGGDTLDGQLTVELIEKDQFIMVESDNTNWHILSQSLGSLATDTLDSNQTTTSATFVDVTGLSTSVTLQKSGSILAHMSFSSDTSDALSAVVGCAIEVNSTDKGEVNRYLVGSNDLGTGQSVALFTGLSPGTYTVDGRFRRVSGTGTVQALGGLCHIVAEAKQN